MNRLLSFACAMGLAASVAGCADLGGWDLIPGVNRGMPATQPVAGLLPAVMAPGRDELRSMTVQSLLDGGTAHIAIRPEGRGIRVDDGKGCTARRPRDWFSPTEAYAGCGSSADWSTAAGEVRVLDSLYPLELGATGRYSRRLVSAAGEVSTRETACAVVDKAAVLRPGRFEAPAWVVRCDDGRVVRTTWYAPGTGPVAYHERHESHGVREAWMRVD